MLNSPDFYIEQIVSGRLSEFAYYIESGKEAIVIDPVREPDPYLSISSGRDATIKYIFLTHYHSDFVSGHLELARRTGAKIVFGPQANAYFDNYEAKDDEEFQFGNVKIKAIHTPGHTIESTCYLLSDSQKRPCYLFTGDTLYIGDVGRIDFAANFSGIPEKELAGKFYDSLWKKLRPLPGSIYICPAHGETSYAGYDTLANQKRIFSNIYAMGKEKFMESIINCSDKSPAYFTNCAKKNKFGYTSLEDLLEKGLRPISLEDFKKCRLEGCTILDTRDAANIQQGFIPGSTTISLKTNFEAWAGTLLDPRSRIILVTERGKEKESIIKLARIGFENVEGYLEGGYKTWTKARDPVQKYNTIAGGQLKDNMSKRTQVLDVRQESEWKEGVVEGSQLISLSELEKRIQELPKDKTIYVYCKLGGRSLIAYSILTKNGFQNVYDVKGGFESVKASGVQLAEPQLQKMKVKEMVGV